MSIEITQEFECPYCAEVNQLYVDPSGGKSQQLLLDCEICCNPIKINLKIESDGFVNYSVRKENE